MPETRFPVRGLFSRLVDKRLRLPKGVAGSLLGGYLTYKRKTLRRRWTLVLVDQLLYERRVQVSPDLHDGPVREAGYPAVPVVEGLAVQRCGERFTSTAAVSPSTRTLLTRKTTPSLRSLSSRVKVSARKFSFVW